MIKSLVRIFCLIGPVLLCFLSTGCEQKTADYGNEVLLRVGDSALTVLDFNQAFEISKTAYTRNIRQQPEDLRDAQMRLLNQLTVELLMLERAKELEISVSDDELERAVAELKSDYPKGEFEETLLEFAVSYDVWRNRLKTRLIMDKVVEAELKNRISISPEDISLYYKKNFEGKEIESDSGQSSQDINEAIVKQLRREKAELAYNSWIEELKTKYPININSEQWDKITAPKKTNENEDDSGESKSD
jgi:hypothetical protein